MTDSDIELTPTAWKVSVTEKVSTGDYENHQPHATLEGEFAADVDVSAHRPELRARLLALQRDLQAVVDQAAENRIAAEGHADWSDPLEGADDA